MKKIVIVYALVVKTLSASILEESLRIMRSILN